VYARTAADDEAGTACRGQVRGALEVLGTPARAAVYSDPGRSGLDADRPGLRRLLADVRRGDLRRVVVRDLTRLARSAALLETILRELRAAGVELLTVEGAERHA
jgi:DNA invertase Pin-like site-specific DNA recombinase